MALPKIEVIDLTESTPQLPPPSEISGQGRSLRLQKRLRTESTSTDGLGDNNPIMISDREKTPPLTISSESRSKPRTRKKKKKTMQLEEGQVACDGKSRDDVGSENRTPAIVDAGSLPQQANDYPTDLGRPAVAVAMPHSSSPPPFYIDDKPDPLPEGRLEVVNHTESHTTTNINATKPSALLLPVHVVLDVAHNNGAEVVTEASAMLDSDTDEFIHYADSELNLFTRYYEEPKDQSDRKAYLVCGQCGAEGDHKQADCPVLVCLTCGAHNEHSTRQCPIIKTCFTCGMKGHINKDCPNKHTSYRMKDRDYYCNRCGSELHKAKECPTLWRMYEYVSDADREATLQSRREKENLPIGQGGEGYIGEDYWCYNCGAEGHLGDDCKMESRHSDSRDPSAFGSYNTMSGPFAALEHVRSDGRKPRREWELNSNFDDGHGFTGPADVGKRGRDKERERMRRREKETREVDGDEEDWFGGRLQSNSRQRPTLRDAKGNKSIGKAVFAFQNGNTNNKDKLSPADRLLGRMSSNFEGTERKRGDRKRDRDHRRSVSPRGGRDSGYRKSDSSSRRDRERDRRGERDEDEGRDRDRERTRSHRGAGSEIHRSTEEDRSRREGRSGRQYFGGYSR